MFFFGVKILMKVHRNKTVAELDFTEDPFEINIEKIGEHAVCIVGGHYASNEGNFQLSITNNGNQLDVFEKPLKFKQYHKGKLATEFYQFETENVGKYVFEFENIADLEVKKSMLLSNRMFQDKIPVDNLEVVIKETSPGLKFIVGLLMTIIGFSIASLGIIFALNPQLFK